MNIFEIEKLFQEEETLEVIMQEVSETFKKIDEYSRQAQSQQLDNPFAIDNALQILQGCYGVLAPIYYLALAEKENKEYKYYCQLKMDIENEGTKFVDASATKEASAYISSYRRVRNILEGYLRACDKGISVLQTRLKTITDPSKLSKEG